MKNNKNSSTFSRRKFLAMTGASLAYLSFPINNVLSKEVVLSKQKPKVIWVLLRGALDSLHAVIPENDPYYKVLRPKLSKSFKKPLLPLDNRFSLHPALKNLHQWYKEKSMLPIVAVSSGYAQRSHFDGQDYLESGKNIIDHESGWLARAIDMKNKQALAISRATPISLRSSQNVNTWYPSKLKNADNNIYSALRQLYQHDEELNNNLESGIEIKGLVGNTSSIKKKQKGNFVSLSKSCAKLMLEPTGPDCAMLEMRGWDTHNNQANRLDRNLTELDNGLAELKSGLGEQWNNTVVIVATEFGRTAKENGTGGTDHGTGSAMFLAGGAVNGGKVKGQWPGLKEEQLFKQRDLMPTTNSFAWFGNVLSQHWKLSDKDLDYVFPQINPYDDNLMKS